LSALKLCNACYKSERKLGELKPRELRHKKTEEFIHEKWSNKNIDSLGTENKTMVKTETRNKKVLSAEEKFIIIDQ